MVSVIECSRSWIRAQGLPNQDRGFEPSDCQIKIVDSGPGTAKSRSWIRAQGLPNQDRGFEPRDCQIKIVDSSPGLPNQDRGFEPKDCQIKIVDSSPRTAKSKTIKVVFAASPLNTQR